MFLGGGRPPAGLAAAGSESSSRPQGLDQTGRVAGAAIEGWWPVTSARDEPAGGHNGASRLHPPTEVGGIDPAPQDHLVDSPQLRHGEGRGQELERDVGVLHLAAQAVEGVVEDLVVVERQLRRPSTGNQAASIVLRPGAISVSSVRTSAKYATTAASIWRAESHSSNV